MSAISLRLDEPLLHEVDTFARAQHIPRTEYIRRAINAMNDSLRQEQRRQQLQTASQRVREANMEINREFAALDGDAISHH